MKGADASAGTVADQPLPTRRRNKQDRVRSDHHRPHSPGAWFLGKLHVDGAETIRVVPRKRAGGGEGVNGTATIGVRVMDLQSPICSQSHLSSFVLVQAWQLSTNSVRLSVPWVPEPTEQGEPLHPTVIQARVRIRCWIANMSQVSLDASAHPSFPAQYSQRVLRWTDPRQSHTWPRPCTCWYSSWMANDVFMWMPGSSGMSLASLLDRECRRPLVVTTVADASNGSRVKLVWLM